MHRLGRKNGFPSLTVQLCRAPLHCQAIVYVPSVRTYTTAHSKKAMPMTRRACRAALFQSIGDDVLTHVLATMTSFADRSAIKSVCKRWTKIVASRAFAQARREVGETGLVLVGYPLYRDPTQRFTSAAAAVVESTAAFIVADGNRVLRGPGINSMGCECA